MAAFHTSNSPTWSDYLTTLPAHTRRAYLDHPPMPGDSRPTNAYTPQDSALLNDVTHIPINELKDPANPHRKRFQIPQPSNSSSNIPAPHYRLGSHLTPKIARATAPKPNGDPSDVQEEVPAGHISPHYMDIDTTGLDPRERTSAILFELRRNPLDPRTRGIPSHNKLIPDRYIHSTRPLRIPANVAHRTTHCHHNPSDSVQPQHKTHHADRTSPTPPSTMKKANHGATAAPPSSATPTPHQV
jgi:hypothetical protein